MEGKESMSRDRKILLGVCARTSSLLNLPLSLVRIMFIIALALKFNVVLVIYLLLALILRP